MRNKPQQLSSYAKRLIREQDNIIASLHAEINVNEDHIQHHQNTILELNNWNYQLQAKNDAQCNFIKKLKSMNLFQLILWWVKK